MIGHARRAVLGVVFFTSLAAVAAPKGITGSAAPALPLLPSIPRVRVDVAKGHVVVIQEINLPRGAWKSGDLDFFVAFGAPGIPLAFDAHVLAVPDGMLEPPADATGEALSTERAPRRPSGAHSLLGRPLMAGNVVHLREAAFRRALTPGNMAALRLRTVLRLPDADAQGAREVIVRLGTEGGTPLTVGRLQIASAEREPFVRNTEAHLCGRDADPYPLSIGLGRSPKGPFTRPDAAGKTAPIAPVLSVRHASDDLCIRFWTTE